MDKKEFIDYAPIYYSLAIAAFTRKQTDPFTRDEVIADYRYNQEDGFTEEADTYLHHELLVDVAFQWLIEKGFLSVVPDRFGEEIYGRSKDFSKEWEAFSKDGDLPFQKYSTVGDRWLQGALLKINTEFERLKITQEDFANPDLDWKPLPLDRDNPSLKEAIKNLEKLVEEVRKDNGYAATLPQERNFVLNDLSQGLATLKEDKETSATFIRDKIIANLKRIAVRFKAGAKHVLAKAIVDGLSEYVKQKAAEFIHYIFSNWPQ